MRYIALTALFFAFLSCNPHRVSAEIFINEFSSATSNDDWIEIYNSGPDSIDLSAYRIRDTSTSNTLDLEGILDPNNFKVFSWGNKLNNPGDLIKLLLKSNENQILYQIGYGSEGTLPAPTGAQTAGRKTDGDQEWVLFETGTKEQSNNGSSAAPTPSPTPSPTIKPTATPKPTKTPIPTPTKPEASKPSPTIAKTVSVTTSQKKKISESAKNENVPSPVLGASKSEKKTDSKENNDRVLVESASQNNIRYTALGFGITALICAIIFFIKIRKKQTGL